MLTLPSGIYRAQKETETDYRVISGDWQGYSVTSIVKHARGVPIGGYCTIDVVRTLIGKHVVKEGKALAVVHDIERRQ